MDREQLVDELAGYRDICTRIALLRQRAQTAEDIAASQLASPTLSAMPHGTDISRPTERVAMRMLSDAETQELASLEARKTRIDTLVSGLPRRERIVITVHIMDGEPWAQTAAAMERETGEPCAERTLRYIMRSAIDRMMELIR